MATSPINAPKTSSQIPTTSQNTSKSAAAFQLAQKISAKAPSSTAKPIAQKAKPDAFDKSQFIDGRYVKLVSDEIDPAFPQPAQHLEPIDPSNPVHVAAEKAGQKNYDAYQWGIKVGAAKQFGDAALGLVKAPFQLIGVAGKSMQNLWDNGTVRLWDTVTGNKADLKRIDGANAARVMQMRAILSHLGDITARIAKDPTGELARKLTEPFAKAEKLRKQQKYQAAGEVMGRALASVPLAAYSVAFAIKTLPATVANLQKGAKLIKASPKTLMQNVKALLKGIGEKGGKLPVEKLPVAEKITLFVGSENVSDRALSLFRNWRQLDSFERKPLLRDILRTVNYSETEIHILSKMNNLSPDDVHRLVKHPAAGKISYVASKHDYVGLVDNLNIIISPKAAASMGAVKTKLAINSIKYNMLILLRNPATKSDMQVVLRKKIPISLVNLDKQLGAAWVDANDFLAVPESKIYYDVKYLNFHTNRVQNEKLLSYMSHENLHARVHNPNLQRSLKTDYSRRQFVVNYAPTALKSLKSQKQSYVKEYLKRRTLEEVYAVRKQALIDKDQDISTLSNYGFDLKGKYKGPISQKESDVFVATMKENSSVYYKELVEWAEKNYDSYYPSHRIHN